MEEKNNVNHPKHYNREGGMECIDEMILVFGKEAVQNFCLCNAWKYRYRAADKNGEEDLKKSDWYLKKYKELTEDNKVTISSISTDNTPWYVNQYGINTPLSNEITNPNLKTVITC